MSENKERKPAEAQYADMLQLVFTGGWLRRSKKAKEGTRCLVCKGAGRRWSVWWKANVMCEDCEGEGII